MFWTHATWYLGRFDNQSQAVLAHRTAHRFLESSPDPKHKAAAQAKFAKAKMLAKEAVLKSLASKRGNAATAKPAKAAAPAKAPPVPQSKRVKREEPAAANRTGRHIKPPPRFSSP